jgi:hypothetical protein
MLHALSILSFGATGPDCSILCGESRQKNGEGAKTHGVLFSRLFDPIGTSAQKRRERLPAPCAENETVQKHKRAKVAKTRENKRLTIPKLKKSKKVLKST